MTKRNFHFHQNGEMHWSAQYVLARFFPRWVLVDILVPLAVTRVVLVLVGWLGFHLIQFPLRSSKWEIGDNGMAQGVAGHLSPNAHPLVLDWARGGDGWYLHGPQNGYLD